MYSLLSRSIDELESFKDMESIFAWASPVPFFGYISHSRVATVGINPSYREFVDSDGNELVGHSLRLETLNSLVLENWSQAGGNHIRKISQSCERYFEGKPYRIWFDVLDSMLYPSKFSYYKKLGYHCMCHIDLVPYSTRVRWRDVPENDRHSLILNSRQVITRLIKDSDLQVLILNGEFVVRQFEQISNCRLNRELVKEWSIPRQGSEAVAGFAYHGTVISMNGVDLDREIAIVGYNHNLQSSYGVTSYLIDSIGERVGEVVTRAIRD